VVFLSVCVVCMYMWCGVCVCVCVCMCVCVWCGVAWCGVCACVCVCACTPRRISHNNKKKTKNEGTELDVVPGRLFWIVVRDGRSEDAGANGRRTAVGMVSGFHRICQHLLMAVCPSSV